MRRKLCTTLHSTCTYIHSYIYLQISNQIWNTYSGTVYDSITIVLQTTGNPHLSPKPCLIKAASAAFWASSKVPPWGGNRWRDIFRFLQKTYLKKMIQRYKHCRSLRWPSCPDIWCLPRFQEVFHARISDVGFHISHHPLTKKGMTLRGNIFNFFWWDINLPNKSQ